MNVVVTDNGKGGKKKQTVNAISVPKVRQKKMKKKPHKNHFVKASTNAFGNCHRTVCHLHTVSMLPCLSSHCYTCITLGCCSSLINIIVIENVSVNIFVTTLLNSEHTFKQ